MDDMFDAWLELELKELQSSCSAGNNKSPTTTLMPAANPSTGFHDRKTRVYNAIPREKQAEAIKLIAAAATKTTPCAPPAGSSAAISVELPRYFSLQSSTTQPDHVIGSSDLQDEVPMAKRQSLQRYLEKRRERILSKMPYTWPKFSCMEEDLASSSNN